MTASFTDKENIRGRQCPICRLKKVYVIESKPTTIYGSSESVRRRRLECANCGYRNTTKEISNDLLDHLLECNKKLEKIKALSLDSTPINASETKSLCFTCTFSKGNYCDLSLPEFKTVDSSDCSMHHDIKSKSTSCKQKPQRKLLMPQGFSQRHATTVASAFSKNNQDKCLAPPSTWSIEGLSMSSSHDSSLPREL
jgi:Zn ribbon nucleic-acid-binding protein